MKKRKIRKIYDKLDKYFGDLGWWPADSAFEVIVGAVLTQNTAWKNVEKAIEQLKQNKLLNPEKIKKLSNARLSRLIRSSGYHRVKAERLKAVCRFLEKECGWKLNRLKRMSAASLREKLLSVKGVGP